MSFLLSLRYYHLHIVQAPLVLLLIHLKFYIHLLKLKQYTITFIPWYSICYIFFCYFYKSNHSFPFLSFLDTYGIFIKHLITYMLPFLLVQTIKNDFIIIYFFILWFKLHHILFFMAFSLNS